jgi:hypothetical protein
MTKRILHVKPMMMKLNSESGSSNPTIVCKKEGKIEYAFQATLGSCTLFSSPTRPLADGTKAWIETHEPVMLKTEAGWLEM